MDEKEITERFKKNAKYTRIAAAVALAGIVIFVVGTAYSASSKNMIFPALGMIIFIGSIIANMVVWRCPVCKKPLPTRQSVKTVNYCSNCGVKLKKDE